MLEQCRFLAIRRWALGRGCLIQTAANGRSP